MSKLVNLLSIERTYMPLHHLNSKNTCQKAVKEAPVLFQTSWVSNRGHLPSHNYQHCKEYCSFLQSRRPEITRTISGRSRPYKNLATRFPCGLVSISDCSPGLGVLWQVSSPLTAVQANVKLIVRFTILVYAEKWILAPEGWARQSPWLDRMVAVSCCHIPWKSWHSEFPESHQDAYWHRETLARSFPWDALAILDFSM